jgi:hypothetical protein
MLRALRLRDYRLLWLGQAVLIFGAALLALSSRPVRTID